MTKKTYLLLAEFFVFLFFFMPKVSSEEIAAHHVPIQLNFHDYQSLEAFQEAIEGKVSLHMTLVFTQIADEMVDQQMHGIFLLRIQNDFQLKKMAEEICFKFKKFGFLGSYLVAFYEPVKVVDQKIEDAWPEYIKFIERCRMIINHTAAELGDMACIFVGDTNGKEAYEQWNWMNGKMAYRVDVRSPIPHISLKSKGSSDDLAMLELLMKDTLQPSFFFIKFTELSAVPTKPVQLNFYEK